jgi:outer membrane protein insertion porin family
MLTTRKSGIRHFLTYLILLLLLISDNLNAQSYSDYEIRSIKFNGNNTFSETLLSSIIENKESPMWLWVFLNSFTPFGEERVYFDSSKVIIDLQALNEFYKSNGFFNAAIQHEIIPDASSRKIELIYNITENHSFNFGRIELIGFEKLSEFEFNQMISQSITIDSSKRFSESEVQQNISSIKKYLVNNGYVLSSYDSTIIKIDTLTFRTDIFIHFETGNKYRISETVINKSGKSIEQINYDLIDEIVGIKPGDIYDQSKVDRSELRLLKTELFTSVDINPIISDTVKNGIPLSVNAEIGDLNQLAPEIKADNEFNSFNFGLGIGYTRKNFFGDARKFNISTAFRLVDILNFNLGNLFKSAPDRDSTYQGVFDLNLKLEQPFLLGRPILTTTEFYLRSQTFIEYSENTYGVFQKFDFEMPPYTFITFFRPTFSLDFTERDTKVATSIDSLYNFFLGVNSFTPGLVFELGSSKTDDILFPTEGNYIFLSPEVFHSKTTIIVTLVPNNSELERLEQKITGSAYFYRIQAGYSNYTSLNDFRTTVFASKLRAGYVQPFTASTNSAISSTQLIPPNKTFYAGGSNSVRAWRSRELVPTDTVQYIGVTTETGALRGGTFWLEGSFELRKKLNDVVGYALFADYGNTWNGWKQVKLADIAVALGAGIRVYTPIAPFRLDFGVKFYNPFDQQFIFSKQFLPNIQIQFGIGEAF